MRFLASVFHRLSFVSAFGVLFLLSTAGANAAFMVTVTPTVMATPSGSYLYEYTIANDAASTLSAFDFSIDISPLANLQAITVSNGWFDAYVPGDTFFYAISVDPATDLTPGTSLSVSFESHLGPAVRAFALNGADPSFTEFDTATGSALAPSESPDSDPDPIATPAPAGLLLGLIGASCLGGVRLLRRTKVTRS